MIRIFVVQPTETFGDMVVANLSKDGQARVIDQATTPGEALSRLGNGNCDVVLVAHSFSHDKVKAFIKALRKKAPAIRAMVTGVPQSKEAVLDCFAAGAVGYISVETPVDEWMMHIQDVHAGRARISPEIAAALMFRVQKLSRMTVRNQYNPSALANLTRRESEVLDLVAQGLSNREIADKLVIGVGTVKNHVHNVLKKLDLNSRKDAASFVSMTQSPASSRPARQERMAALN